MTTGDAQQQPEAQNRASLNGKILRLNLDGTIPADNPVAGSPVYTLGHRNPQGLVRSPTGKIYSSEHGPDNDDELNLIEPNRNYGWPTVQGFCDKANEQSFCTANNVREPLAAWTPTLAVSGVAYYNSPAIPDWQNSILMLSLKASLMKQLQLNVAGEAIGPSQPDFLTSYGRLRAICVSPQGRVYVGTSNRDGRGNPAATDDRILVLENLAYVPTPTTAARQETLGLWPNPARNSVTLRLPAPTTAATTAEVHDVLGRLVLTTRFASGQSSMEVSLAGLKPGLYSAQVVTPEGRYKQRLVVE
jgi:hypothetical protein